VPAESGTFVPRVLSLSEQERQLEGLCEVTAATERAGARMQELAATDSRGFDGLTVDALVRGEDTGAYRYTAELKWARNPNELGWTLWDIYKMVAATYQPGTEACSAIVGAPRARWETGKRGAALYSTGIWESRTLFEDYESEFHELLLGGTARLLRVPIQISTMLVADVPLRAGSQEWRLRCLAVGPASMHWLEFDGDWPVERAASAGDPRSP
jgi:hypothetical protein